MSIMFKVTAVIVFAAKLFLQIQSDLGPGQLYLPQKYSELSDHDFELLNNGSRLCRTKFNPEHVPDWNKNIKICAEETGYRKTELVGYIHYLFYSRQYTHDDKCFHHCVLKKMGHLTEEQVINFTVYRYNHKDKTVPTDRFEPHGKSSDFVEVWLADCDLVATLALAEVYVHHNLNFDPALLMDQYQAPWNNASCIYANIFSHCLRTHAGNLNIAELQSEKSYMNCFEKQGIQEPKERLYYNLCVEYFERYEDNDSDPIETRREYCGYTG